MTFPPEISKIFRIVVSVALVWNIMYFFKEDLNKPDRLYLILLKISVCFTAFISYLNDKDQMFRISSRGLLFEDIQVEDQSTKFSFLFIIIAVIYNPIIALFYSKILWVISDGITVIFFFAKSVKKKN